MSANKSLLALQFWVVLKEDDAVQL